MAAPPKLWEQQRTYNHRQPNFNPDSNSFMQSNPFLSNGNGGGGGMPSTIQGPAPPLPPRPTSYGLSSNSYMRHSYGPYGNYGGYGGYSSMNGPYGSGFGAYNRFGMMGSPSHIDDNRFIQLAEESSRPAFESIESIVHAFGSVSMMLESTFHAVHSSFRAVLGVAEHFGRMKSHFAQIFSALAMIRTLRWLYRKLLYLIGLRVQDPSLEMAWQSSGAATPGNQQITEADIKASKSSWPIIMFLAVVFGGPYLIWRLLSSLTPPTLHNKEWMRGKGDHYGAVAVYPFKASHRNELSLNQGQMLCLAPQQQQPSVRGWLLASNGASCGLVPANYIKITGRRTSSAPNTKVVPSHNTTNNAQNQFITRNGPLNNGLNEGNVRTMTTAPYTPGPYGTAPQRNPYPIHTNPPTSSHHPVNQRMPLRIPPNQVQNKPNTYLLNTQQQPLRGYPINPQLRPGNRESSSSYSDSDDSDVSDSAQNGNSDQFPSQLQNTQTNPDNTSTGEKVNRTNEQGPTMNGPENRLTHEFSQLMQKDPSQVAQNPDKVIMMPQKPDRVQAIKALQEPGGVNKTSQEPDRVPVIKSSQEPGGVINTSREPNEVMKSPDNLSSVSEDPRGAREKVRDSNGSVHSNASEDRVEEN